MRWWLHGQASQPDSAATGKPPKRLRSAHRAKPLARDAATAGFILDLLTNEIHRLKGAVGRGMYEVGVRLGRIADERLWASRGYTSFEHYLEEGVSFSRSTGYKLLRIARQFDAEVAERYGVEKLRNASVRAISC